jgi:DNA polymerase III epsilon subunit-like protein
VHRENLIMSEIKTIVYCDLEATGLKSSGRPRISEVSLVAVNIEDVLELHTQIKSHLPEGPNEIESMLPRVMNKLTVCVYPMSIIRPEVSEITGLDNYNLSGQSTFDRRTGELINNFLARLPGPLCLVAHNGDLYDFPLLKAELEKAKTTLLSKTLCADSYVGIQEIFKRGKWRAQQQNAGIIRSNFTTIGSPRSYSLINLHKHLFGCYPTKSHGAEADCLTLLRTTAVLGTEWLDWLQENSQLFSNCQRMWYLKDC